MEKEKMEDIHLAERHEELRSEWIREEEHLQECVEIIRRNVDAQTIELSKVKADTKELYDNYRSNNPELHNDLVIGLSMQSDLEKSLNKNMAALNKPFFGRIDYRELEVRDDEDAEERKQFCLYIGKNGVSKSSTEIIVVDWRAPVSSVYYDSDVGESSYLSPYGDRIYIGLDLKRTFEIKESSLIDYYDTDVIANDEFLTKYLGKNKEAVLGEIIATIQKEQNDIIRDTPWHSVIVQGVAGSGKTTVAMHRISYILYNYKERCRSDEFYIIGSNKMLLNYITGVLPNLDVYNINQMTLEEFFVSLLDKDFELKKKKYTLVNPFAKSRIKGRDNDNTGTLLKQYKGSLDFIKALEFYVDRYEATIIRPEDITYHGKNIYTENEIREFLTIFKEKPLAEKQELLNKRLESKIRLVNEREQQEKEIISIEVKKYRDYFGKKVTKFDFAVLYLNFLESLLKTDYYEGFDFKIPGEKVSKLLISDFLNKRIDIYDLAMIVYLKKRLKLTKDFEYVSHIIVDEAQDFGVSVFYCMKRLFGGCTYTIMGDITQNIHYDTGMNDWEALKNEVFLPEKDRFYVLAKSYRNTVEISNYASHVLRHCTFKTYEIEPIIRHGREVGYYQAVDERDMQNRAAEILRNSREAGYTTQAVICRSEEETREVYHKLKDLIELEPLKEEMEEMNFAGGIMVLPIHMTKGLEFDSVLLWNPDINNYEKSDADAKLLYVAITRALHELHIVCLGELAELLR